MPSDNRIAASVGDADIVFLKNHGVLVLAPTVAQAWDDLYYLERAADVQLRAMSSGRPLKPVPKEVAQRTFEAMMAEDAESARLHLESVKRRLKRSQPDYLE